MRSKTKNHKTLEEYKEFWDGPKVGFNEELYKEYLEKKRKAREEYLRIKMN